MTDTNSVSVDARQPATLTQIKDDLRRRANIAASQLDTARKERDKLNARIKELVAELDEAQRILRGIEPRKVNRKPKGETGGTRPRP